MEGQEIKSALGRNIKFLRAQRQFSQALLAEKANISITFLSNIERGLKYPKPAVLSKIAESLAVEVYELFKMKSEPIFSPVIVPNDQKKLLNRLSKVMTRKVNNAVNNAMEGVFKDFMK
ncbi:MAG: helix-turn-helix domain-containing protein [Treponema sp.]|jgi:transcriptional regulator with XRE-family HTH domain|nr:helix-turn-helix domain-containing protein [Treponema sp.]